MNKKIKLFGIAAAAVFSFGLATGTMAQSNGSTVTLENGNGDCSAVFTSSQDFDFGTWEWNGSAYVLTGAYDSNESTSTIRITQDLSSQPITCTLTVSVGDLENGSSVIDGSTLTIFRSPWGPGYSTPPGATGVSVDLEVTLNSVESTLPSGTYTGDITISVTTASN